MKAGLSYTQAWGAKAAEFQLIRYPSMMKVFFFFFFFKWHHSQNISKGEKKIPAVCQHTANVPETTWEN